VKNLPSLWEGLGVGFPFGLGLGLIFLYQPISADEKEYGYAIVAKKREEMDEQVAVEREELVEELQGPPSIELVLVFLHGKTEEVAIVVQDNS
jgi:hypothetical protein